MYRSSKADLVISHYGNGGVKPFGKGPPVSAGNEGRASGLEAFSPLPLFCSSVQRDPEAEAVLRGISVR